MHGYPPGTVPTVAENEVRLRTRLDHVLLTAHEGARADPVA